MTVHEDKMRQAFELLAEHGSVAVDAEPGQAWRCPGTLDGWIGCDADGPWAAVTYGHDGKTWQAVASDDGTVFHEVLEESS